MGLVRHEAREVEVISNDRGDSAVRRLRRWLTRVTHESSVTSPAQQADAVRSLLAAADERDAISDARDAAAEQREREIDLTEMLDTTGGYGDHWAERREATLDRAHAKEDRAASREDRIALTHRSLPLTPGPHTTRVTGQGQRLEAPRAGADGERS